MTSTGPAGVLVAHTERLFRDAARSVIDREDDLVVVAEAADGVRAVTEAIRTKPEVVVSDQYLVTCDGLMLTRVLLDRVPGSQVILLVDEDDHMALVRAIEAGAHACVPRDASINGLTDTIRAVLRGKTIVPASAFGDVFSEFIRRRNEKEQVVKLLQRLTFREREVLGLLASGQSTDGIATSLDISRGTARTHVHHLMQKLDVHSRLGAVALVTRNGLVE
jgi:DNA-binding NarL/FixJ family response regulator